MKTSSPLVKSLREFVRDVLLERIARSELIPGQRVVEATLVKEFSISATPVREAIRPTAHGEILLASFLAGELQLKLTQSFWKRRSRHSCTLPLVAC